jgi:hypothetical protein
MIETTGRDGTPMFVGSANNGLHVLLVRHAMRTNAAGKRVQVWRLVALWPALHGSTDRLIRPI